MEIEVGTGEGGMCVKIQKEITHNLLNFYTD